MPPSPLTHFLCVPLVTRASRHQLSTTLSAFSADVTSPDSFAVPDKAIRPLGTLHLTIGVMSFPKDEGLEKAVALLKTQVPKAVLANVKVAEATPATSDSAREPDGKTKEPCGLPPLFVTLKGLKSMQTVSKTSVLYTSPVDGEGTLQRLCKNLQSIFEEAGLMVPDSRPLLLHATIMNTIYIKGRHRKGGKLTIDARGILDRYDDYVWMEDVPVEKIAICKMGAKKQDDGDEAYEVEAEIDLI
ncbi:kinase A anchor protein [Jackrogersella minutella]|nr:kinase A anchor protein [Jackrogersella minutella]